MFGIGVNIEQNTLKKLSMGEIRRLGNRQSILIVNENQLITKIIEPLVGKSGFHVQSTDNALDVFDIIKEDAPDIIILDLLISFVTAYELIKFIRDYKKKYIKIIILTKVNLQQAVVDCFNLGVDDYISLPLHQKELLARLKRMNRYQIDFPTNPVLQTARSGL